MGGSFCDVLQCLKPHSHHVSSHVNGISTMTQILLTLVASSLWVQASCQGVTQHPAISWSHVSESAEMNCSHNKDAGHSQMYWYRQRPGETMTLIVFTAYGGKADYGGAQDKYSAVKDSIETGALSVKSLTPEDSAVYFCAVRDSGILYEAYFGQGTKLTVLEEGHNTSTPNVQVLKPSKGECGHGTDNKMKTLVCVAKDFYPDHVTVSWQKNGADVTDGVATDNEAIKKDKKYSITSRMMVSNREWFDPNSVFTCYVRFYNGTTYNTYDSSITGEKGPDEGLTRETFLKTSLNLQLSYTVFVVKNCVYGAFVVFVVWKLQGSTGK